MTFYHVALLLWMLLYAFGWGAYFGRWWAEQEFGEADMNVPMEWPARVASSLVRSSWWLWVVLGGVALGLYLYAMAGF